MNQEQLDCFWATIRVLDGVGLLRHVMLIGSWVEYLYEDLFESGFSHSISTKDIDFLYPNIHKPKKKINLVKAFIDEVFIDDVDPVDGISRIYKENLIEIEFIAQVKGSGLERSHD